MPQLMEYIGTEVKGHFGSSTGKCQIIATKHQMRKVTEHAMATNTCTVGAAAEKCGLVAESGDLNSAASVRESGTKSSPGTSSTKTMIK